MRLGMSIRVASPNIEPHSIFLLTFVHLTAPTHVLHFYSSKSGLSPPVPRGSPPKSVKARNLSFALLTWVPHVLLTSAPLLPTFAVARCCCMLLPPVRFTLPPPASPLPSPSPYSGLTRGLTERHELESRPVSPESRPASPVRTVRAGRVSRPRLPPVPGTHSMTLRPSTAPQRVPLPSPPASSLPDGPDPESDSLRAASPTLTRFLATAVTDPLFESSATSALVAELVDFAAASRLDYAASLVAESVSASVCPPSVGGECALRTDVVEDRQEDLECFAAASPHLVSMLLAPEGDSDALDIPTPRSYAEAIEGPYSSLDFSTAFLQGSLHEEIWLRRPPGFTGSFPPGTQWSLRRPVYGLHQAPRQWHDTLRMTLATLGFAPSTADPSLFLRTDTSLPPFYVLVYVDGLVFATADTEALAHVNSELQKRHTCTDL
ncbi:unnamed protein product, partial [Closterium sp. NIES-54]